MYDPLIQGQFKKWPSDSRSQIQVMTLWCTVSDSDKWPSASWSIQKSIFTTLSSQYKVSSIQNLRPSRLSTRSKWRTTTLLSPYKVSSIQNLRPSRLSTRSKWRTTMSQYKVSSIQNLRPSHLSTRSKWRTTTLSSQYKVKMKNDSEKGKNVKVFKQL